MTRLVALISLVSLAALAVWFAPDLAAWWTSLSIGAKALLGGGVGVGLGLGLMMMTGAGRGDEEEKPDSSRYPFSFTAHVQDVVDDVVKELAPRLPNLAARLQGHGLQETLTILATQDTRQFPGFEPKGYFFRKMILELLANAYDATPTGPVTVHLLKGTREDEWSLRIENEGRIDVEELQQRLSYHSINSRLWFDEKTQQLVVERNEENDEYIWRRRDGDQPRFRRIPWQEATRRITDLINTEGPQALCFIQGLSQWEQPRPREGRHGGVGFGLWQTRKRITEVFDGNVELTTPQPNRVVVTLTFHAHRARGQPSPPASSSIGVAAQNAVRNNQQTPRAFSSVQALGVVALVSLAGLAVWFAPDLAAWWHALSLSAKALLGAGVGVSVTLGLLLWSGAGGREGREEQLHALRRLVLARIKQLSTISRDLGDQAESLQKITLPSLTPPTGLSGMDPLEAAVNAEVLQLDGVSLQLPPWTTATQVLLDSVLQENLAEVGDPDVLREALRQLRQQIGEGEQLLARLRNVDRAMLDLTERQMKTGPHKAGSGWPWLTALAIGLGLWRLVDVTALGDEGGWGARSELERGDLARAVEVQPHRVKESVTAQDNRHVALSQQDPQTHRVSSRLLIADAAGHLRQPSGERSRRERDEAAQFGGEPHGTRLDVGPDALRQDGEGGAGINQGGQDSRPTVVGLELNARPEPEGETRQAVFEGFEVKKPTDLEVNDHAGRTRESRARQRRGESLPNQFSGGLGRQLSSHSSRRQLRGDGRGQPTDWGIDGRVSDTPPPNTPSPARLSNGLARFFRFASSSPHGLTISRRVGPVKVAPILLVGAGLIGASVWLSPLVTDWLSDALVPVVLWTMALPAWLVGTGGVSLATFPFLLFPQPSDGGTGRDRDSADPVHEWDVTDPVAGFQRFHQDMSALVHPMTTSRTSETPEHFSVHSSSVERGRGFVELRRKSSYRGSSAEEERQRILLTPEGGITGICRKGQWLDTRGSAQSSSTLTFLPDRMEYRWYDPAVWTKGFDWVADGTHVEIYWTPGPLRKIRVEPQTQTFSFLVTRSIPQDLVDDFRFTSRLEGFGVAYDPAAHEEAQARSTFGYRMQTTHAHGEVQANVDLIGARDDLWWYLRALRQLLDAPLTEDHLAALAALREGAVVKFGPGERYLVRVVKGRYGNLVKFEYTDPAPERSSKNWFQETSARRQAEWERFIQVFYEAKGLADQLKAQQQADDKSVSGKRSKQTTSRGGRWPWMGWLYDRGPGWWRVAAPVLVESVGFVAGGDWLLSLTFGLPYDLSPPHLWRLAALQGAQQLLHTFTRETFVALRHGQFWHALRHTLNLRDAFRLGPVLVTVLTLGASLTAQSLHPIPDYRLWVLLPLLIPHTLVNALLEPAVHVAWEGLASTNRLAFAVSMIAIRGCRALGRLPGFRRLTRLEQALSHRLQRAFRLNLTELILETGAGEHLPGYADRFRQSLQRILEVYALPGALEHVKERKVLLTHLLLIHLRPESERRDAAQRLRDTIARELLHTHVFASRDPRIFQPALEAIIELLARAEHRHSQYFSEAFYPSLTRAEHLPRFAKALVDELIKAEHHKIRLFKITSEEAFFEEAKRIVVQLAGESPPLKGELIAYLQAIARQHEEEVPLVQRLLASLRASNPGRGNPSGPPPKSPVSPPAAARPPSTDDRPLSGQEPRVAPTSPVAPSAITFPPRPRALGTTDNPAAAASGMEVGGEKSAPVLGEPVPSSPTRTNLLNGAWVKVFRQMHDDAGLFDKFLQSKHRLIQAVFEEVDGWSDETVLQFVEQEVRQQTRRWGDPLTLRQLFLRPTGGINDFKELWYLMPIVVRTYTGIEQARPLTAAETGTMKRLTQTAYAILKALDIAASDPSAMLVTDADVRDVWEYAFHPKVLRYLAGPSGEFLRHLEQLMTVPQAEASRQRLNALIDRLRTNPEWKQAQRTSRESYEEYEQVARDWARRRRYSRNSGEDAGQSNVTAKPEPTTQPLDTAQHEVATSRQVSEPRTGDETSGHVRLVRPLEIRGFNAASIGPTIPGAWDVSVRQFNANTLAMVTWLGMSPTARVVNVASGHRPLAFPAERTPPINLDGNQDAQADSARAGAVPLPLTSAQALAQGVFQPTDLSTLADLVILHHMELSIDSAAGAATLRDAWSMTTPGGWLLLMMSPAPFQHEPMTLRAQYQRLLEVVEERPTETIVVSPQGSRDALDEAMDWAIVVAVRKAPHSLVAPLPVMSPNSGTTMRPGFRQMRDDPRYVATGMDTPGGGELTTSKGNSQTTVGTQDPRRKTQETSGAEGSKPRRLGKASSVSVVGIIANLTTHLPMPQPVEGRDVDDSSMRLAKARRLVEEDVRRFMGDELSSEQLAERLEKHRKIEAGVVQQALTELEALRPASRVDATPLAIFDVLFSRSAMTTGEIKAARSEHRWSSVDSAVGALVDVGVLEVIPSDGTADGYAFRLLDAARDRTHELRTVLAELPSLPTPEQIDAIRPRVQALIGAEPETQDSPAAPVQKLGRRSRQDEGFRDGWVDEARWTRWTHHVHRRFPGIAPERLAMLAQAVVLIKTPDQGLGSGFVLDEDAGWYYVATAAHVVYKDHVRDGAVARPFRSMRVRFRRGWVRGELVAVNYSSRTLHQTEMSRTDVAMIRINKRALERLGQAVVPLMRQANFSRTRFRRAGKMFIVGRGSNVPRARYGAARRIPGTSLLELTTNVPRGFSGSAVVGAAGPWQGQVIGVLNTAVGGYDHATDITEAKRLLTWWKRDGDAKVFTLPVLTLLGLIVDGLSLAAGDIVPGWTVLGAGLDALVWVGWRVGRWAYAGSFASALVKRSVSAFRSSLMEAISAVIFRLIVVSEPTSSRNFSETRRWNVADRLNSFTSASTAASRPRTSSRFSPKVRNWPWRSSNSTFVRRASDSGRAFLAGLREGMLRILRQASERVKRLAEPAVGPASAFVMKPAVLAALAVASAAAVAAGWLLVHGHLDPAVARWGLIAVAGIGTGLVWTRGRLLRRILDGWPVLRTRAGAWMGRGIVGVLVVTTGAVVILLLAPIVLPVLLVKTVAALGRRGLEAMRPRLERLGRAARIAWYRLRLRSRTPDVAMAAAEALGRAGAAMDRDDPRRAAIVRSLRRRQQQIEDRQAGVGDAEEEAKLLLTVNTELVWLVGTSLHEEQSFSEGAVPNPHTGVSVEVRHPERLAKLRLVPKGLVCWDFDETLWLGYPREAEARFFAERIIAPGRPVTSEDLALAHAFIMQTAGKNWVERFAVWSQRHPGEMPPAEQFSDEIRAQMKEVIRTDRLTDPKHLTPGVAVLLARLSTQPGLRQAILTGGDPKNRADYAVQLGIRRFFHDVRGEGKKTERFARLLEEWGFAPDQAVLIGDGGPDVEAAHAIGALAFAFARTPADRERLIKADPDVIINGDFTQLEAILRMLGLVGVMPETEQAIRAEAASATAP